MMLSGVLVVEVERVGDEVVKRDVEKRVRVDLGVDAGCHAVDRTLRRRRARSQKMVRRPVDEELLRPDKYVMLRVSVLMFGRLKVVGDELAVGFEAMCDVPQNVRTLCRCCSRT